MVQALHRALPERGIGVWSFDFPAHGDSPMGQEGLRVPFCMDDLETVEAWIRAKSPQVEVCYFASSFGAYITLLSLSRAPRNRPRAFLRSAAVTMPQLVARWLTPRAKKDLERRGYFVPDYAYVREMRITPAFLRDLWEYDLFSRYTPELASLFMVHGALDEVVPVKDARRFWPGRRTFSWEKNEVGRQEKASVPLKFVGIAGIIKMYWSAFSQCRGKENHVAPSRHGEGRARPKGAEKGKECYEQASIHYRRQHL